MKITRVEYQIENNTPVLYVFQRIDGHRILKKVRNFTPYFYISAKDKDRQLGLNMSGPYWSINGEELLKVYAVLPSDVPVLRDLYPRTWEADVLFPIRYQIDMVDKLEFCNPKVMFIDIETTISSRVPNPYSAPEAIICTTIYTDECFTTFVWRHNVTEGVQTKLFNKQLHEIHYYNNEIKMMQELIDAISKEGPDILSGWNSNGFDIPYIINRAKRLGLDYSILSPMRSVYIEEPFQKGLPAKIIIKGVNVIDLMDTYKRFSQNQEEGYTLDYIAQKVAGVGKNNSATEVNWLWNRDLDKLIEYNTNDCLLLHLIDDKLLLLDYLDELRRLCFCNMEDCLIVTRMADSYILKLFHGQKVFPTRVKHTRTEFEGAIVNAWGKGIYENVVVFDVRSLYPSIMVSAALSPENLVMYDKWKNEHPEMTMEEFIDKYA